MVMDLMVLLQGPFAKSMDSPYYSKSELCEDVMMVSFSKYLLGKWCTSYNTLPTSQKQAAAH
jgi:hypothetical protein